MEKLKKCYHLDWRLGVLIIFACLFFCLYSFLAFDLGGGRLSLQNSPDETANLFFARSMAENFSLQFSDPSNKVAGGLVSPRSMRVINGQTAPAGFLGLPLLYGVLGRIFGLDAIPFFTPFLGAWGVIIFYLLISELFDRNSGFVSALLLLILPGWWYYSTKGLMPNVAFVFFFLLSLLFYILAVKKRKIFPYLIFGAAWGLALMIRPSEVAWLFWLFLLLTIFNWKKINWTYLILGVLTAVVVFSPVLYFNQQIYGSPLSIGYVTKLTEPGAGVLQQGLNLFEKFFLPFGFHPKTAAITFYNFTYGIFPIWTIAVLLSLIFSIIKYKEKKSFLLYSCLFIFISLYLIIYYGSWNFHDNLDPEAVTIGTSYIRYWLPVYVFSLAFIGLAFNCLKNWRLLSTFSQGIRSCEKNLCKVTLRQDQYQKLVLGQDRGVLEKVLDLLKNVLIVILFLSLSLVSYQQVMLNGPESIFGVQGYLNEYQNIAQKVVALTPDNAIIVAGRMDKVFFSVRRVVYELKFPQNYDKIKELAANGWPVYYFSFTLSSDDFFYLNQTVFETYGLKLGASLIDFTNQSLYPLIIID